MLEGENRRGGEDRGLVRDSILASYFITIIFLLLFQNLSLPLSFSFFPSLPPPIFPFSHTLRPYFSPSSSLPLSHFLSPSLALYTYFLPFSPSHFPSFFPYISISPSLYFYLFLLLTCSLFITKCLVVYKSRVTDVWIFLSHPCTSFYSSHSFSPIYSGLLIFFTKLVLIVISSLIIAILHLLFLLLFLHLL